MTEKELAQEEEEVKDTQIRSQNVFVKTALQEKAEILQQMEWRDPFLD